MKLQKNITYALGLFTLFIVLSILVITKTTQGFNQGIISLITSWRNPILTKVMIFITYTGEWFIYLPIIFVLMIFPKFRMKYGIPLFIALFLSAGFNIVFKHIFSVPRPDAYTHLVEESGFGFPSGHATNSTAFIGFLAYLLMTYSKKELRTVICVSSITLIALIGISRVYLGVHSPTDIIGGVLLGSFVLNISIFGYKKIQPRIRKTAQVKNRGA